MQGSVADLRSMGWNDRISSLRRVDNGRFRDRRSVGGSTREETGTGITVYIDVNFGGQRSSSCAQLSHQKPVVVSVPFFETLRAAFASPTMMACAGL